MVRAVVALLECRWWRANDSTYCHCLARVSVVEGPPTVRVIIILSGRRWWRATDGTRCHYLIRVSVVEGHRRVEYSSSCRYVSGYCTTDATSQAVHDVASVVIVPPT